VDEIEGITGVSVGYSPCGALRVATSLEELEELRAVVRWQSDEGLNAELLSLEELQSMQPGLAPSVIGGAYFKDDAQVEPEKLMAALVNCQSRLDVDVRPGLNVSGVLVEGGRCIGVSTENGPVFADMTLLAAGSWSGELRTSSASLDAVCPARGQLIEVRAPEALGKTIVAGGKVYLVPRNDGRIVCGTTTEFVGHKRENTLGGLLQIMAGSTALLPTLDGAEWMRAWCSFRPYSSKASPIVGRAEIPGLYLATGHHRNGILLAPTTAAEVVRTMFESTRQGGQP
jgi:glycine oxidase